MLLSLVLNIYKILFKRTIKRLRVCFVEIVMFGGQYTEPLLIESESNLRAFVNHCNSSCLACLGTVSAVDISDTVNCPSTCKQKITSGYKPSPDISPPLVFLISLILSTLTEHGEDELCFVTFHLRSCCYTFDFAVKMEMNSIYYDVSKVN